MSDQAHEDGRVIPLRAIDAGTETHVTQAEGPAYADLTDGHPARKPVIPDHWRTKDARRQHVRLATARHKHAAAYHGVRAPAYLVKTVLFACAGIVVVSGKLIRWWHVPAMQVLESQAAASGNITEHLRLHKAGKDTRKARGIILALCAVAAFTGLIVMLAVHVPWFGWAILVTLTITGLARAGRPASKPIITPAVVPAAVLAPSQDVITRALAACGIPGIDKWLRDGKQIGFPAPVREDGPGWRAEVDLPYGVTAAQVIDRREQLASGLRRPLGAVWPEPVTDEHAGRLELWVGRQDLSKTRQSAWPLLKSGTADVFGDIPFGTDVRGRIVHARFAYHNWLIGSIPRQGKTATVRVLACAAALDPLCELWVHELKGSGDLDPLERVSYRFTSGVDDASIGYAAESLTKLRREVELRTERLKALGRDICPDKRTTREIAGKRSLKLHPIAGVFDEVQNLFSHPEFGKQAGVDAEFVIKIGPAFGVFLMLATQRPDKASLPTGVSGNVSDRLCHKVMGQLENDMILGTSAYKQGIRATSLRAEIDAGIGYYGAKVTRVFYLNMAATERVAERARQIRERAGTLTGVALGQADEVRDVLADLAAVFDGDAGLKWTEAAARLAGRFPQRWADASADGISAEARSLGVPSVDIKADGKAAKGCRRDAVEAAASAR